MSDGAKSVKHKIEEQHKLALRILWITLAIILVGSALGVVEAAGKSVGYFVAAPCIIALIFFVRVIRPIKCTKCNLEIVPGIISRVSTEYIKKIKFCPHCAVDLTSERVK